MPLVRLEVRNEYGLGDPDVYRTAPKDDSRALLEGVSVAGLVGILRQFGDLAEFAGEIFHDLHDKVAATAARSQNMMVRIKHLEAGLPSLEHASLAQTSHIHFAYTAGSDWHASVRTEQNHLTRGDLPGFIMDSYEECHGPPRLFLLDKFDAAGAGACLKRYSDPSFFKVEWTASELTKVEKVKREKKTLKSKKKSRRQRNGQALSTGSFSRNYSGCRMFYTLDFDERNQNIDDFKKQSRFESFTSRTKTSYMERLLDVDVSSEHGKVKANALYSSSLNEQFIQVERSVVCDDQANSCAENKFLQESSHWGNDPESPCVTWHEKAEVVTPASSSFIGLPNDESQAMADRTAGFSEFSVDGGLFSIADMDHHEIPVDDGKKPDSCAIESQDSVVSEPDNFVDALNIMESEVETDSEGRMKKGIELHPVHKELMMKSVIDEQEIPHISDLCDVETPSVSASFLNDELADCFSQVDLPNSSVPGTLIVDVFENDVDAAPDIEMKKEAISSSIMDEGVDSPAFPDRLAVASDIATAESENSRESCSEMQVTSLNFWTNGGLLGLQPSKPPDFTATKAPEHNYDAHGYIADAGSRHNPANWDGVESYDKIGGDSGKLLKPKSGQELHGSPKYVEHPDVTQLRPSELVQNTSTSYVIDSHVDQFRKHSMQRYDGFFEKESESSTVIESSIKVEHCNNSHGVSLEGASILFSGSKLPVLSSAEVQSTVSISTDLSSTNDLQRKSVGGELGFSGKSRSNGAKLSHKGVTVDTTHDLPKTQNAGMLSQRSYVDTLSESRCSKGSNYVIGSVGNSDSLDSHCSECSSPPLEHMKISFDPMNDLDPSLKLDFPVGHHLHERIKGIFSPSSHWLPRPISPLRETQKGATRELSFLSLNLHSSQGMPLFEEPVTSKQPESEIDSDDDTFCKRSLNFSEDMLSQDFESNSEQWECNDVNGSKDDLYDDLCRISSVASISSSVGHEETAFLSVNSGHHDSESCSNSRISSAAGLVGEVSCHSQTLLWDKNLGPNKLLSSVLPNTVALQPPSSPTHFKHTKSTVSSVEDQNIHQSFPVSPPNVKQHETTNKTTSMWQTDERETLLEEIRAKSFNLKRAVKTRSDGTSSTPTTNNSVAAILEKANAIRQAFAGSEDGGEDDSENWSEH